MPIPHALAFRGAVPRGMSLPQLFTVEGLGLCAIKFAQNPQGKRVLTNELIGFQIADLLGLEHPPCGLVKVDSLCFPTGDGHLLVADIDGVEIPFLGGMHFYSQWLESSDQVIAEDLTLSGAVNTSMLAGVVLLDLLLHHWDREPRNTNLIVQRVGSRQRLKLIDLGLAFGSAAWFADDLQRITLPDLDAPLPYAQSPTMLLKMIQTDRDFAPYLERLPAITDAALSQMVSLLPVAWNVTDSDKLALLNLLSARVKALPSYLEQRLKKKVWW